MASWQRLDSWDADLVEVARLVPMVGPKKVPSGSRHAVASHHPVSSAAGMRILRAGGSAADAAIAMVAVDCVVCPGSSTLAGSFVALADDGRTSTIVDGGMATVQNDREPYDHARDGASGRAVLVPGTVNGLELLWERFGRLAWQDLWDAAISVASEGFVIGPWFAANLAYRSDLLRGSPSATQIFAPDGQLPTRGDVFCQPHLAETLQAIAASGAKFMRSGSWASECVDAISAAGGHMQLHDLTGHRARTLEPVAGPYRDHAILTCPPNKLGGPAVLLGLAITEALAIDRLPHRSQSANTVLAEIAVDNTVRGELAKFGRDLQAAPEDERAEILAAFGPDRARQLAHALDSAVNPTLRPRGSHSVAAADADGLVVAANHTIYSDLWGDTGIFVGGVALNSTALQRTAADPGPGERIHDFQSTLAVRSADVTVCVADATGSGQAGAQVQVLADLLARRIAPDELLNQPRWGSFTGDVAAGTRSPIRKTDPLPEAVLAELAARGAPVDPNATTTAGDVGWWNAILRAHDSYRPITDPRRTGIALAE